MPGRHRGLSEMERSLLHRIQVIGQIIEVVRAEKTFDLAYSANGEWSIFAKKKTRTHMIENESILSGKRWIAVGVAFVALLVLLIGGMVVNQPPPPPVIADEPLPAPWLVGQTAIVIVDIPASEGAGPAADNGAVCEMAAGVEGTVVELGRSLSNPRLYVELQTDGCNGWVPASVLIRP